MPSSSSKDRDEDEAQPTERTALVEKKKHRRRKKSYQSTGVSLSGRSSSHSESEGSSFSDDVDEDYSDVEATVDNSVGDDSWKRAVSQRVRLTFKDVSWSFKGRPILRDCSGALQPGRLVAIIGGSGAGKTTLLNVLSGRLQHSDIRGEIWANNQPLRQNPGLFREFAGYVRQNDHLYMLPQLTVFEQMEYSARMRLPKSISQQARRLIIENILETVLLSQCKNIIVGTADGSKGLSGGQRKRLAVALEFITSPSLMFLDEPTSGLDSATTRVLLKVLKQLTRGGRTIVLVIHQPSASNFKMFDDVLVLSKGQLVYTGPTKEIVTYFGKLGYQCPQYENPCDWIVEQTFDPTFTDKMHRIETQKVIDEGPAINDSLVTRDDKLPGFWDKSRVLMKRTLVTLKRDKLLTRMRIGSHVGMGTLIGLLFLDLPDTQAGITDRQGFLFFSLVFLMLASLLPTVLTFPIEKTVFLHEYHNNWYTVAPYYLTRSAGDLPIQIVAPVFYGCIVYWMAGLQDDGTKFVLFLIILVAQGLMTQALGILISAAMPDLTSAVFSAPTAVVPLFLLCGFLINMTDVSEVYNWVQWLTPVRYAFQGLIVNEFKDLDIGCKHDEYVGAFRNRVCPITDGQDVIDNMNFDTMSVATCIYVLFGWFFFFRLLGFFALYIRAHRGDS